MEKKNIVVAIVAVGLIAAAAFRVVTANGDGSRPLNSKPFEHLGRALAEETHKLLGGQGSVVLVVETMGGGKGPNVEAQVVGFKAALAKHKGVSLKEVKELSRSMTDDPRLWPAQHAAQLVSSGAGANAIVYLGSFPESLSATDLATLKGNKASLVVIGTQSPLVQSLVKSGVVRLAIVSRTPPPPPPGGEESAAQWYVRVYEVLRSP